jgi:hypothetical protein
MAVTRIRVVVIALVITALAATIVILLVLPAYLD